MRCQPCYERKKIEKKAFKDVMGTAMCQACYSGIPETESEVSLDKHGFEVVKKQEFPKRYATYERRLNVHKAIVFLDAQPIGTAVKVKIEEGDSAQYLRKYVHQVAERKYFHVETRIRDGQVFIRKGIDR